ncbi:MAG: hypothetical protein IIC21_01925, partial [Chloroflexi bacterium]|nr:hypothetical protein [Chloroflexota bacterium]
MDVFGVDADVTEPPVGVNEVWPPDRLDDLLKISDWFVVAVPYTAETDGIIDGRRIGLMKPGSYMIVLSRGGIVDEDAVVEALVEAGMDRDAGIVGGFTEPGLASARARMRYPLTGIGEASL